VNHSVGKLDLRRRLERVLYNTGNRTRGAALGVHLERMCAEMHFSLSALTSEEEGTIKRVTYRNDVYVLVVI
jgi:hypothetical protein